MTASIFSRSAAVAALVSLLTVAAVPAVRAETLDLTPASTTIGLGDSFTLDLSVSDVKNGIGAWDAVLKYTSSGIIGLTGISFSDALGASPSESLTFTGSDFGAVSFLAVADLLGRQPSSFTLATLTFDALKIGTTEVSVAAPNLGVLLADANGLAVVDPKVGVAMVAVVPEPATYALFAVGVAVLCGVSARRRARST